MARGCPESGRAARCLLHSSALESQHSWGCGTPCFMGAGRPQKGNKS